MATVSRDVARGIAVGRIALGASLLLAPELVGRRWLGDEIDGPATQVVVRGLGARDVILGGIALHTVDHEEIGPRWVATCAIADAVDAGGMALVRDRLPASKVWGTVVVAAGSAIAGFGAAATLKR